MKIKGFIWNMILGGFLGFLWIIFSERVVDIANSFQSPWLLGGLFIVIGTVLFGGSLPKSRQSSRIRSS